MNKIYLTQEGYEKLSKELDDLKRKRRELAEKIEEARQEGDLSENAEYHAAREMQGQVQAKLIQLEDKLSRFELINNDNVSLDKVCIGVKVVLLDEEIDDEFSYVIMSDEEANLDNDEIGVNSPLAKAMLGKGKGEVFDFQAPRCVFKYKIKDILLP